MSDFKIRGWNTDFSNSWRVGGTTRDKESILARCATLDIKEFEFWDFKNGKILEFLEFLGQPLLKMNQNMIIYILLFSLIIIFIGS